MGLSRHIFQELLTISTNCDFTYEQSYDRHSF